MVAWPCMLVVQGSLWLAAVGFSKSTYTNDASGLTIRFIGYKKGEVLPFISPLPQPNVMTVSICRYGWEESVADCCAGLDTDCDGKVRRVSLLAGVLQLPFTTP